MRLRIWTDAVNDTLKAIAASLLMEQVLAPKFDFRPKNKNNEPTEGFDYGDEGYDPQNTNVGFNENTGQIQLEIDGLAEPKSAEAQRICEQDINEVIAAYVQDPRNAEQGLFNENLPPEELTQVKMGRIVKERYPDLDEGDQEAVRQRAIAAVNVIQKAKTINNDSGQNPDEDLELTSNTALIDGIRKFAMNVRDLDIDLIDSINPFGEAYSILAKTMSEDSLKRFAEVIAGKK